MRARSPSRASFVGRGGPSVSASLFVPGPEAVLQRSLRIRLMEVVGVDPVGPQPTKALADLGAQHLRPAAAVATLRRHDADLARGREGEADRLLLALPGPSVGSAKRRAPARGRDPPSEFRGTRASRPSRLVERPCAGGRRLYPRPGSSRCEPARVRIRVRRQQPTPSG